MGQDLHRMLPARSIPYDEALRLGMLSRNGAVGARTGKLNSCTFLCLTAMTFPDVDKHEHPVFTAIDLADGTLVRSFLCLHKTKMCNRVYYETAHPRFSRSSLRQVSISMMARNFHHQVL